MKKFILCLIVLFSLTAVCFAQPNMNSTTEKVAVLTDLPSSIANTYDINARIVRTATRVFPYPRFEILSYDDTVVAKKNFVKERGISGNWGKSDISFVGSMVNADYVFFTHSHYDHFSPEDIEKVKKEVSKYIGKPVIINVVEVARIDADAQLVAENIAQQLENRISFRRAMKSCMSRTMKAGALGVKTSVSGRLGGADMARTEFYSEGTIPLQTLRADIDYGFAEADTTYGKVGVKVWVYKGEVLPEKADKEGEK